MNLRFRTAEPLHLAEVSLFPNDGELADRRRFPGSGTSRGVRRGSEAGTKLLDLPDQIGAFHAT